MDAAGLIEALAGWPGARWLRASWEAYALMNAGHILALALLVGPILILDARLVGLLRRVPLAVLAPLLSRAAGLGLALAVLTGVWLFTVRPAEYLANPAFLTKLGLIALAVANLALLHARPGWRAALAGAEPDAGARMLAALSALLWICVLIAGRWIGFV